MNKLLSILVLLLIGISSSYAIDIQPDYPYSGVLNASKGKFVAAKQDLEKALMACKQRTQCSLPESEQARLKMNLDIVIWVLHHRIKASNAQSLFRGILKHDNDFNKAIAYYNKALNQNPKLSFYVLERRANLYLKNAPFNIPFEQIKLPPKKAVKYFEQKALRHKKNQIRLAISDYSNAIKVNPNFYDAYLGRAKAYRASAKFRLSIADYNKAIQLNPKRTAAYLNRAQVYWMLGERLKSCADYKRLCKLGNCHRYSNLKGEKLCQ